MRALLLLAEEGAAWAEAFAAGEAGSECEAEGEVRLFADRAPVEPSNLAVVLSVWHPPGEEGGGGDAAAGEGDGDESDGPGDGDEEESDALPASRAEVCDPETGRKVTLMRFSSPEAAARFAEAERRQRVFVLGGLASAPADEPPELPLAGCYALPSCAHCLERIDVSVSGIVLLGRQGQPDPQRYEWCAVCAAAQDPRGLACAECGAQGGGLWVCMVCAVVGCGRYDKSHMVTHFERSRHRFTLDLDSHCVWDYEADGFVHRVRGLAGGGGGGSSRGSSRESLAASGNGGWAAAAAAAPSCRETGGYAGGTTAGGETWRGGGGTGGGTGGKGAADEADEAVEAEEEQQEQELTNTKLQSVVSFYDRLLADQLREQYAYFEGLIDEKERRAAADARAAAEEGASLGAAAERGEALAAAEEHACRSLERELAALEARLGKLRTESRFLGDLNETLRKSGGGDDEDRERLERTEAEHRERLGREERKRDARIAALRRRLDELLSVLS